MRRIFQLVECVQRGDKPDEILAQWAVDSQTLKVKIKNYFHTDDEKVRKIVSAIGEEITGLDI